MASKQDNTRKKNRKVAFYKRKGLWLALLLFVMAGALFSWVFVDQYTKTYRQRATTYDLDRINDLEIPSLIVDRNDKEIGRIFVQNRSIISMDDVPEIFVNALIAGEDSRFRTHEGVDYMGILRAGWLNFRGSSQGASTITQQVARNAYNLKQEAVQRKETTIQRKLVEAFLAMRIEKRYTKREILGFYLNRIYFGSGFYGIRSAALGYFGKEPKDLGAEECASMVTLIKNPTNRSPLNNPQANKDGRNYVLMRMGVEGMLSKSEVARLQALPLTVNSQPLRRGTTHLYERVADAVTKALGEEAMASGGFKVHTTILAEAQNAAEKALEDSLSKAEAHAGYVRQKHGDYRRGSTKPPEYLQGAVLMVDHDTGEVLAHVGGRDYSQAPYDFIENGRRPLGTAFFPFLYSVALSAGQTPASLLEDTPMDNRAIMIGGREGILGEWGAEVSSPVYEGQIPLRKAFEFSKIAATVRLGQQIGLQRIVDGGVAFGFPMQKTELLPRLCVGWEQVSMKQAVRAISTFSRAGRSGPANLVYVDYVEDPKGRVVYRRQKSTISSPQVLDEATAYQVHSMMAGSMDRGTSAGAHDGLVEKPFSGAGKGGSTQDFSDTWFLGYNKRVTCGVWTGFLQGSGDPIYPGAFSRDIALPVWQAAMNAAAPSFGGGEIAQPKSVIEVPVCSVSGQRATQFCQHLEEDLATGTMRPRSTKVMEYFRKGTENLPFCSIHSGMAGDGVTSDMPGMPALDVVAVRPQAPVLIGDDPYHTEAPAFTPVSGTSGLIRKRIIVLDSLDIGNKEEGILLRPPGRMVIQED
jgi:penicillin-binding protein 1A